MQAIGPEATYKNLTLKTGVDGEFSLLDEIGDSVEVSVSKEGYFLPKPQQLNFGYGRPFDFVPDKENPQIFVLMSSAAEKSSNAVSFKFRSKLPAEHGVRSFDIVRNMSLGQPDAAHITLFFERDPPLLENGDKDFNWTLRIKVNDGGVIVVDESAKSRFDTKTSFMHEAPEDGCVPIIERSFRAGMDQWKSSEVITFYFRTGNNFGKGVLEINAGSSANEVPVNLLGVLNLDGSRRLGGN